MKHGIEAAFRYRLALVAILLVASASSLTFANLQPPELRVTGRVWMNPSVFEAAAGRGAPRTSAEIGASAIHEFLNTRSFCIDVGRRSGLTAYLGRERSQPPLDLPGRITRLQPEAPSLKADGGVTDDAAFDLLRNKVLVSPIGPDVVELSVTFPDGRIGTSTLRTLIARFAIERIGLQRAQAEKEAQLYRGEVDRIALAIGPADAAVADYVRLHPTPGRGLGAPPDAALLALRSNAADARQRFERATFAADAAGLRLAQLADVEGGGLTILDAPRVAPHPNGADRLLAALVGGITVGLSLAIGAVYILAAMDRPGLSVQGIRSDAKFVGEIPRLSKNAIHRTGRTKPAPPHRAWAG